MQNQHFIQLESNKQEISVNLNSLQTFVQLPINIYLKQLLTQNTETAAEFFYKIVVAQEYHSQLTQILLELLPMTNYPSQEKLGIILEQILIGIQNQKNFPQSAPYYQQILKEYFQQVQTGEICIEKLELLLSTDYQQLAFQLQECYPFQQNQQQQPNLVTLIPQQAVQKSQEINDQPKLQNITLDLLINNIPLPNQLGDIEDLPSFRDKSPSLPDLPRTQTQSVERPIIDKTVVDETPQTKYIRKLKEEHIDQKKIIKLKREYYLKNTLVTTFQFKVHNMEHAKSIFFNRKENEPMLLEQQSDYGNQQQDLPKYNGFGTLQSNSREIQVEETLQLQNESKIYNKSNYSPCDMAALHEQMQRFEYDYSQDLLTMQQPLVRTEAQQQIQEQQQQELDLKQKPVNDDILLEKELLITEVPTGLKNFMKDFENISKGKYKEAVKPATDIPQTSFQAQDDEEGQKKINYQKKEEVSSFNSFDPFKMSDQYIDQLSLKVAKLDQYIEENDKIKSQEIYLSIEQYHLLERLNDSDQELLRSCLNKVLIVHYIFKQLYLVIEKLFQPYQMSRIQFNSDPRDPHPQVIIAFCEKPSKLKSAKKCEYQQ